MNGWFGSIKIVIAVIFSVFILNFAYTPAALAGDNYNAATDTY